MKKMLVLNGSHSEIPLILEAKKLGYYVITTGNNKELVGHTYADAYRYGDYSDKEKMLQVAAKEEVDAVCACANDFGAISAAYVAEKLNLPGHDSFETARLLHQKDRFKRFAKEHGIQTPLADSYESLEEAVGKKASYTYPVIVKTVDLTGGKGVLRADDEAGYTYALRKAFAASRKGKVVVEKFITGTYHSFSTFLLRRKVVAYFSDNEYAFSNPYAVATSGGPASNVDKVRDLLVCQAETVAEKLRLVDGVFHMQYVMDGSYTPYIIDIARRCSGDLYPEPVEHATGIPWAKWIVMAEAGFGASSFVERGEQKKYCGRHCIMAKKNGTVRDVYIAEELKDNLYKSVQWWKKGDAVQDFKTDKLGILFMEFASEKEMLDKLSRISSLVQVFYDVPEWEEKSGRKKE